MTPSIYVSRVKESLADRRVRPGPRIGRLVAMVFVAVLPFLALAVFIGPGDMRHREFLEGGIVTWMSGGLLALTSLFAFSCFLLHPDRRSRDAWFWALGGIGFLYLCLDELLQGHERLGYLLHDSPLGDTTLFRGWNDVILIGYGLGALAVLLIFLPEVLKHSRVAEFLGFAAGLFAVHTAIDSIVVDPNSTSIILEESAKLFSVTLFATASFCALISIRRET